MPHIKGMYEHYIREALSRDWDEHEIETIINNFKKTILEKQANDEDSTTTFDFTCYRCGSHKRAEKRDARGEYCCYDCNEPTNASGLKRENVDYYRFDGNKVIGTKPWIIPYMNKICPYDLECNELTGVNAEKMIEILGMKDRWMVEDNLPSSSLSNEPEFMDDMDAVKQLLKANKKEDEQTCTCFDKCHVCYGTIPRSRAESLAHRDCPVHGKREQESSPSNTPSSVKSGETGIPHGRPGGSTPSARKTDIPVPGDEKGDDKIVLARCPECKQITIDFHGYITDICPNCNKLVKFEIERNEPSSPPETDIGDLELLDEMIDDGSIDELIQLESSPPNASGAHITPGGLPTERLTSQVEIEAPIVHVNGDGKGDDQIIHPVQHLMDHYGMTLDDAREVHEAQTDIFAGILNAVVKEREKGDDQTCTCGHHRRAHYHFNDLDGACLHPGCLCEKYKEPPFPNTDQVTPPECRPGGYSHGSGNK